MMQMLAQNDASRIQFYTKVMVVTQMQCDIYSNVTGQRIYNTVMQMFQCRAGVSATPMQIKFIRCAALVCWCFALHITSATYKAPCITHSQQWQR